MNFIGFCLTAIITFAITIVAYTNIVGIVFVKFRNKEFNSIFGLIFWIIITILLYLVFYRWFNDYLIECIVVSITALMLALANLDSLKKEDIDNSNNKNINSKKSTEYCCPDCQTDVKLGSKKCPNCGCALDWSDVEEAILESEEWKQAKKKLEKLTKSSHRQLPESDEYFSNIQLSYLDSVNSYIETYKKDNTNSKGIPVLSLCTVFEITKTYYEMLKNEDYDPKELFQHILKVASNCYTIWKELFPEVRDLIGKYRILSENLINEKNLGISKDDFEVIKHLHMATISLDLYSVTKKGIKSIDSLFYTYEQLLNNMPDNYTLSFYKNSKKRNQLIVDMKGKLLFGKLIK